MSVDVVEGSIQAYLNLISERTYNNNGYLAVPINVNNSRWTQNGTTLTKLEVRISKDDPVLFCYYCFYFLTVKTNVNNSQSSYRVSVTPTPDGGEDVQVLGLDQTMQLTLPAIGSTLQRKFILDQKEPFIVQADVQSGKINMYVTLNPG